MKDNKWDLTCHICKAKIRKRAESFRSHMREHIKKGEISAKDELKMRMNLKDYNK